MNEKYQEKASTVTSRPIQEYFEEGPVCKLCGQNLEKACRILGDVQKIHLTAHLGEDQEDIREALKVVAQTPRIKRYLARYEPDVSKQVTRALSKFDEHWGSNHA